jgi:tetratricopeptide (TPR) repeat protein
MSGFTSSLTSNSSDILVALLKGLSVALIGWLSARWWKHFTFRRDLERGRYLLGYSAFYGAELDRHKHAYVPRWEKVGKSGLTLERPIVQDLVTWIEGSQTFLILFGEVGIGKSRCVIEAARGRDLRWINLKAYKNTPATLLQALEHLVTEGMVCVCDAYQDCQEFDKLVELIDRTKGRLLVLTRDLQAPQRALENKSHAPAICLYKMSDDTLRAMAHARGMDSAATAFNEITMTTILAISEGVPAITLLAVDYYARRGKLVGIENLDELLDSIYSDFEAWAANQWPEIKPALGKVALIRGAPRSVLVRYIEYFQTALLAHPDRISEDKVAGDWIYSIQPGILSNHVAKRVYFQTSLRPYFEEAVDEFLRTNAREILLTLASCNQKEAAGFFLSKAKDLDAKTVFDLALSAYTNFRDIELIRTNLGDFWTRVHELTDAQDYNKAGALLSVIAKTEAAQMCWDKALAIYEAANDQGSKGLIFINLGSMYQTRNEWDKAIGYFRNALEVYTRTARTVDLAQTLNYLGAVYAAKGDWPSASENLNRALDVCSSLGGADPQTGLIEARTHLIQGSNLLRMGDLDGALGSFQGAAAAFERSKSVEGTAKAYTGLSLTWGAKGDWGEAQQFLDRTLNLPGFFGDLHGIAEAYEQFGNLYRSRSDWQEAERLYITAKGYFDQLGDDRKRAQITLSLGWVYHGRNDWKEAARRFDDAKAAFEQLNDELGIAQVGMGLGAIFHSKADWDEAIRHYTACREVFRRMGDEQDEASAIINIGQVYQSRGDWKSALPLYETARETFERLGNRMGVALVSEKIGSVALGNGELNEAATAYQRSLDLAQQAGNVQVMFRAYAGLGAVQQNRGEWDLAIKVYREALGRFEELGDQFGMLDANLSLGSVYLGKSSWNEAVHSNDAALAIAERIGSIYGQALARSALASVHSETSEWDRAAAEYLDTLEVFNKLGDRRGAASSQRSLGWIYFRKGEWEAAIKMEEQSLAFSKETDDRLGVLDACHNLGAIYLGKGDYQKAIDNLERCIELETSVSGLPGLASSYNGLGMVYNEQGRPEEALRVFGVALGIATQLKALQTQSYILTNMGTAHVILDQWPEAEKFFRDGLEIKELLHDDYGIAWTHGEVGLMHLRRAEWADAESSLVESYETFSRLKAAPDASRMSGRLRDLSSAYRNDGDEGHAREIEETIQKVQNQYFPVM